MTCSIAHEQDRLTFFSRVASSVSVELDQLFAGIDQTIGLLSDMLILAENGRELKPEKLRRIYDTLRTQLNTGAQLVDHLNSFAYSADVPSANAELTETLADILSLLQRFLVARGVGSRVSLPEKRVSAAVSPFKLQHAVFLAYQALLTGATEGDYITLTAGQDSRGLFVTIQGPIINARESGCIAGECDLDFIDCMMKEINGSAEITDVEGETRFKLSLPT